MPKLSWLLLILLAVGCKSEQADPVDVSHINVAVDLIPFHEQFYNTEDVGLAELKTSYPFLFPVHVHDSIWVQRRMNEDERLLFELVMDEFGDLENERNSLRSLFQHVTYYHPEFRPPQVYTLISNIDEDSQCLYADPFLFLSLDMYLGSDQPIYEAYSGYLSRKFDRKQLIIDVAENIADSYLEHKRSRQLIESMIEEGKKLFLIDAYLPDIPDYDKIRYSREEWDWAMLNESEIWRYFVDRDLLYSSDPDLILRFVAEAPFSKFYLDIDSESPGKIGIWMGWQIVKSYMKENDVNLQQMLATPGVELFQHSKYKPSK